MPLLQLISGFKMYLGDPLLCKVHKTSSICLLIDVRTMYKPFYVMLRHDNPTTKSSEVQLLIKNSISTKDTYGNTTTPLKHSTSPPRLQES
jgi:hypothetical protein